MGLRQFFRDLALIPAIWRQAVREERERRFRASPEGPIAFEDEVIRANASNPDLVARLKATAPSGRFQ